MTDDERRLAERELAALKARAARADKVGWRGLWLGAVVVSGLLSWLVFGG